jgi:hypothetical protein
MLREVTPVSFSSSSLVTICSFRDTILSRILPARQSFRDISLSRYQNPCAARLTSTPVLAPFRRQKGFASNFIKTSQGFGEKKMLQSLQTR